MAEAPVFDTEAEYPTAMVEAVEVPAAMVKEKAEVECRGGDGVPRSTRVSHWSPTTKRLSSSGPWPLISKSSSGIGASE